MNAPTRFSTPYKGPNSYQVEDAALFFGRGRDAELLGSRILSSRLTLLHAQSGAGKTSLLNAEVIPALEAKGWIPVRVLPQNDPVASVWVSTLAYVLPPIRAEHIAIQRIRDELAEPNEDPTIAELLKRYDALPMRDPRKRRLISPIESDEVPDAPRLVQCPSFTPYVCRLFRSTCDVSDVAEHFRAIAAYGERSLGSRLEIRNETRVADLADLCADPVFEGAYQAIIAAVDSPNPKLRDLLQRLVDVYGARRLQFSLVIILDQFEEVFARFIDVGSLMRERQSSLPDWRLKYEFFEQLRELYASEWPGTPSKRDALPIRYVISMRSEYIAQLDPIRAFAPELDSGAFRLELLDLEGARQAIELPAQEYGFGYTEECYKAIARELTKEERFVEPAHVQIVCEKLWTEEGRKLSEETEREGASAAAVSARHIGIELYRDRLKGAAGIMQSFLQDFLDSLDEQSRLEALELLEPLITGGQTRNIIEREALIVVPFRSRALREQLLDRLVGRTIVRVEMRLGGKFVEITHEFLIPPIREAIQKYLYADPDYTRCRATLRMLARLEESYTGSQATPSITSVDFNSLNHFRDRVEWTSWSTLLMFREAVRLGATHEEIRFWAERFSAYAEAARGLTDAEAPARDIAVEVVREFLASSNVRERRNALKALAARATDEAAETLIAASLNATDSELCDDAVTALADLGNGINGPIARILEKRLLDPDQGRAVYALLGRLRRMGSPISVSLPPRKARLRLAWSLFGQLYPRGTRNRWGRVLRPATISGLWVVLVWAIVSFSAMVPKIGAGALRYLPAMLLGFAVLGVVLFTIPVIMMTWRTSPFRLYYDSTMGRVSEVLSVALGTLLLIPVLAVLVGALAALVFYGSVTMNPIEIVMTLGLYLAVALAATTVPMAVRLGCMRQSRSGVLPSRLARTSWGALCGSIVATVVAVPLVHFYLEDVSATNLVVFYTAFLPFAVGLAYTCVSIDDQDVFGAAAAAPAKLASPGSVPPAENRASASTAQAA